MVFLPLSFTWEESGVMTVFKVEFLRGLTLRLFQMNLLSYWMNS
jgi:hypothetical protein